VKHGAQRAGACFASYKEQPKQELYDIVGTFIWIFQTHVQQCKYVATGRYNYIYACPQTPHYYYYEPRFPTAGPR
jgi:hypothetical protein